MTFWLFLRLTTVFTMLLFYLPRDRDIAELAQLQAEILDATWAHLKPKMSKQIRIIISYMFYNFDEAILSVFKIDYFIYHE